MARRVDTFLLNFVMDSRKFSRNLRELVKETKAAEQQFDSVRDAASDVFSGFNLFDVAQVGAGAAFVKKSVDAYGELVNAQQTAIQVFGESYDAIEEWSKAAVEAVGLSERAATESATYIAGLAKQIGFADEELATFSTSIVQLGADLAAAFNTDTQDAIDAIQSGFAGTSVEPLRKYNIVINDLAIKQEVAALTGEKVVGVLSQQERSLGFLSLLYKNSADYTGQWAREADGLLGTQQRLKAQFENTAAVLGETYAPAALSALDATLALASGFASFDAKIGGLGGAVAGFAALNLALTPARRAVARLNENLAETSGRNAAITRSITTKLNPALVGLTALISAYSLYASNAAKASQDVIESVEGIAVAAGDTGEELEAFNSLIRDMAEAQYLSDEGTGLLGFLRKAGELASSLFTGSLWREWLDYTTLSAEEAEEAIATMAGTSLESLATLRELVAASDPLAQNFLDAGINIKYIDEVIAQALTDQERFNDANQGGARFLEQLKEELLGVGDANQTAWGEEEQKEFGDELLETIKKIKAADEALEAYYDTVDDVAEKSASTMREVIGYFNELADVRLDAQAEALDSIFEDRGSGFRTLTNIRNINLALSELIDIEGNLGNIIGEAFDTSNEDFDTFLSSISTLAEAIQTELQNALASEGVEGYARLGREFREQINAGLIAAGADETTINEVLASFGLTDEVIQQDVQIVLDASATAEAVALLDLLRDEGLLGTGAEAVERFITLSAIVEDDPQKGLNALYSLAEQQGVQLNYDLIPNYDEDEAEQVLRNAGLTADYELQGQIDIEQAKKDLQAAIDEIPDAYVAVRFEEFDANAELEKAMPENAWIEVEPRLPPPSELERTIQGALDGPDFQPSAFIDIQGNTRPATDAIEDDITDPAEDWNATVIVSDSGTEEASGHVDDAAQDRYAKIYVDYVPRNSLPAGPINPSNSYSPWPSARTLSGPPSPSDFRQYFIYNPPGTPQSTYDQYSVYTDRNGTRATHR